MGSNKDVQIGILEKVRQFSDAIKFQESVFALPFAYTGMILSTRGFPGWDILLWITIAMVSARTFGMVSNRVIDKEIDKLNPRTQLRHLPQRILSVADLLIPGLISLIIFVLCAWQLNYLALLLSPVALAYLVFYPYTKRFTWASNLLLGWALAIAPSAAWIGVTGEYGLEPFLLSLAVALWAGSFDILYHTQDVDFQRDHGLYSVAAKFGVHRAFNIAKSMDVFTVLTLVCLGIFMSLHAIYYVGCLAVAFLLVYKYMLVKPNDLSRLGMAFMRINAFVSTSMLIATILAIVLK
jgi:4-hydroxybenzoate polyprenyltransferase